MLSDLKKKAMEATPKFSAEEARRGYAWRGNTKWYCCYGMYCEAGHSSDCKYADGVSAPDGETSAPPAEKGSP